LVFDLVKPELLMVPAAKSTVAEPPPLAAPAVDRFECYRMTHARRRVTGVNIEDQFGAIVVDVKRPMRLCMPTSQNGSSILDADAQLVCYQVRVSAFSPAVAPPFSVFTNDQFGPETLQRLRPTEICVPAVLAP
jgi:hypothetical protein